MTTLNQITKQEIEEMILNHVEFLNDEFITIAKILMHMEKKIDALEEKIKDENGYNS